MMQRLRSFPVLALVVFLVAGIVSQQSSAALELPASYSGSAQISGPLQLELSVSPTVSTPGDTLSVELRLTNQTKVTSSPEVILRLPSGFHLNAGTLPAGTTLNLQTNAINWLPIAPANGGVQQLSLQLRVETADIAQPEKQVTAVLRHEGEERSASATIWVGIPPRITGFLNAPQVAVGQPVQLRVETVGSAPLSQVWHLGDGRRVAVNDPVVVYPAAGINEVTLELANPLRTVSRTGSITVVPHPAAQFRPDDPMPGIDQTVSFVNESGGQPPLTFTWEFGDGATSNEANPSHQYGAPGVYRVHLLVQNEYGQSEAFWPVTVGQAPTADLVVDERVAVGQPLPGQAFGDESVTSFRWDMGDGRLYEGEQISHVYGRSGDYYVTMTASNDYGATEVGRWVHVDPGTLALYLPFILRSGERSGGAIAVNRTADPLGVVLEPVALDAPFVLEPVELPSSMSPAEQLFHYINEVRATFDLEPVQHVSELSQAAQQHTEDMASYAYAGHAGSDGSLPAERLLWQGYSSGYAGEATAWGFEHPYEAVEYWVNSAAHRRIILNRNATDVGVGFTVDYSAPNVWYWTAEFGNRYGAATQPLLRLQAPSPGSESMITDSLSYGWNWPVPLAPDQHFTVYVHNNGRALPLGTTSQRQFGIRYTLQVAAFDALAEAGEYEWQVKLEDSNENSLLESERRPITFIPDPNLPTPTSAITATATTTATLATPTPTPTPTPAWSTPTPRPPSPTPAVLVTATPMNTVTLTPTPTPSPSPTPTPEEE